MKDNFINNIFKYKDVSSNSFIIPNSSNNIDDQEFDKQDSETVFIDLNKNLEYLRVKYNTFLNSDVKIRHFTITINKKDIPAFIIFIDGMVSDKTINDYILQPLLLRNSITMKNSLTNLKNQILSFDNEKTDLRHFLYKNLIPQNNLFCESKFENIISRINSGFCALFVNSLDTSFCIETKGYKFRSIDEPKTESVVKGSHEGFVEDLRTNTALLRKIINSEKLIVEEIELGKISKTKVAICYMRNITNDDLVSEVKFRLNNLSIDYLISAGQLEHFIIDNYKGSFPQIISTERSDKTANYLFLGRVIILVNGSPFSIVLPAVLSDFLTSPEDFNFSYIYANFLRFIRLFALLSALLVPGMYIAITVYHYELIPSELLYAIIDARKAIPFPIIFEILIMELCFELIQEASIRAPSSFTTAIRNNWCPNSWRCCRICKYCKPNINNYSCVFWNMCICYTR